MKLQVVNLHTRDDFLRSLLCPWDFLVLSLSVSREMCSGLWCCFRCFLPSSSDLLISLEDWISVVSILSLSALSFSCASSFSFSLLCFPFLFSLSSLSSFFDCCNRLQNSITVHLRIILRSKFLHAYNLYKVKIWPLNWSNGYKWSKGNLINWLPKEKAKIW